MFCKNCSAPINENMSFCRNCGTRLVEESLVVSDADVVTSPEIIIPGNSQAGVVSKGSLVPVMILGIFAILFTFSIDFYGLLGIVFSAIAFSLAKKIRKKNKIDEVPGMGKAGVILSKISMALSLIKLFLFVIVPIVLVVLAVIGVVDFAKSIDTSPILGGLDSLESIASSLASIASDSAGILAPVVGLLSPITNWILPLFGIV